MVTNNRARLNNLINHIMHTVQQQQQGLQNYPLTRRPDPPVDNPAHVIDGELMEILPFNGLSSDEFNEVFQNQGNILNGEIRTAEEWAAMIDLF